MKKKLSNFFISKEYADYLKDENKEIIVKHCYNKMSEDEGYKRYIKLNKTYLKIESKNVITEINNFPMRFLEMLETINNL